MDDEMKNCPWLLEKVRTRDDYAQNLYAAMCNMRWIKLEVIPILKDDYWTCSWRASGGIVADLQGKGDYLDWYCSGMGGLTAYDTDDGDKYMAEKKFVSEGTVTDEIRNDLLKLGWVPSEWPNNN
jgi:hypothetical protein